MQFVTVLKAKKKVLLLKFNDIQNNRKFNDWIFKKKKRKCNDW